MSNSLFTEVFKPAPSTDKSEPSTSAGVLLILSWAVTSLFPLCLVYHFCVFFLTRIKHIFEKYTRKTGKENREGYNKISGQSSCGFTADCDRLFCILEEVWLHTPTK